jgi:hypothetical protein
MGAARGAVVIGTIRISRTYAMESRKLRLIGQSDEPTILVRQMAKNDPDWVKTRDVSAKHSVMVQQIPIRLKSIS